MLKILCLRDALRFDDSCFIRPDCPDLFEVAPAAPLAAVPIRQGDDPEPVLNMGVMLARRDALPFLRDFEAEYERQGHPRHEGLLINAAVRAGQVYCAPLDPRFNRAGSQIAEAGLDAIDAWVYHLKSYLHELQRIEFARRLAKRFAAHLGPGTRKPWQPPRVETG